MMNENGQYKLAGKKKLRVCSHTSVYSDNKYDVMIAILLFLFLLCIPEREKKEKKNKLGWSSRNLYQVRTEKKNKKRAEDI
jgi:hypothetical protein